MPVRFFCSDSVQDRIERIFFRLKTMTESISFLQEILKSYAMELMGPWACAPVTRA